MREVRVYDGDFRTWQQMLAERPGAALPKEAWLQQMQPGEFAVRYKDFKTGLARSPAGELVQSSEICRIFDNLEEARADSRRVVDEHWLVRCFIYDHTGAQVDAISNTRELNKFAALQYFRLSFGIAFCSLVGMALVWLIYRIWFIVALGPSVDKPLVFGWFYWLSYAAAGLLLGALLVYLRFRWIAKRSVSLLLTRLDSAISLGEKKRFAELKTLYPSRNPDERGRFVKLANEYEEKIREALKR